MTRVFVDGQQVLEANGKGSNAQPAALRANQPSTIRVEFDYEHSGDYANPFHPPAAMLFWQGPGISKQLVPAAALAPPAEKGQGPGLWGEYSADQPPDAEGKPRPPVTMAGVDPQIDFLWTSGSSFWYRDFAALAPVVNELVKKASDTTKLKEKNGLKQVRGWVGHAELLTTAQRSQCARALANDPELLRKMSRGTLLSVLHAYRVGTEEEAIDLIGKWSQIHAGSAPYANVDYFTANRNFEFNVAAHFTHEYKGGCVRLEEDYLEVPDGSCAVPAAYIVGYSRAFRGELEKWVEALDARLADPKLGGDQRASWLIARAQAEEMRGYSTTPRQYEQPPERYHAGFGFLDEASLVAESEAMKLRVFYERITRCVAVRPYEVAPMLEGAKQHFTSESAVKQLARFEKSLQQRAAADAQVKVVQDKKRAAQYLKRLAGRKKRAEAANDEAAVARYGTLLEAAQPAPATKQ